MTAQQIDLIRRALSLLEQLLPEVEPGGRQIVLPYCSVREFAKRFLMLNPERDITTAQLWTLYCEVVDAGELEPLSKPVFLRRLPEVMREVFGVRKSHSTQRDGQTVRGFKSIAIREEENTA